MSRPASVSPVPQAPGLRVALVVSTYHDDITERLATGALEALAAAGVSSSDIERLDVPGAYEIPFGARTAATSGRIDAVVCLGCLIKGETPHFDYIASAVSHGIMQASLSQGTPMAFGVLTVNSLEEAEARVPAGPGNKGHEAAVAVVTMAKLAREWQPRGPGQGSEG
ncbi:6,7-dimethyl-8-ribityllumazine synthase [Luteitalea pratensis]|uniref:6,7-dimethyl-8-ribityllumazine synthase n=1 Tax=Luteitalea pratensis TaxID=1855912 RepID=A0A143PT03_LUTPR|nr:6,7-dimethyl-8-ribityllumazine synthase [Luteitalea pratensis]AMY11210.1 6,7-dimethyl-8-ribityllumazine synthase [Luteitalea pratensis]